MRLDPRVCSLHIVRPMSAILSPAAAAQRAGVSRWTVSRALKAGDLRGQRDNLGAWRIDQDDLDAWASKRLPAVQPSAGSRPAPPAAHPAEVENAALRAEVVGLRERVADLAADRDAWRSQAQELAARPSWWASLFRR